MNPTAPYTIDLTPQQAYEKMREYFSQPGAKLASIRRPNNIMATYCSYHMLDEDEVVRQCAVGCLFEPEVAQELEFAGGTAFSLFEEGVVAGPDELREFLSAAQTAHDGADTVEGFLKRLDERAAEYGIEVAS